MSAGLNTWTDIGVIAHKTKEGYEVKKRHWRKTMKKADNQTNINFALGRLTAAYAVNLVGKLDLNILHG